MTNATIIGIDTAKSVFYLHAINHHGKQVFRKKLYRDQLLQFIAQQPPVTIAGSMWWKQLLGQAIF